MKTKRTILLAAGLAALFFAVNAAAISDYVIKDEVKLDGIIYAAKWTCPKADRPCRAYFELNGPSAKKLFDNMKTPAVEDICTEGMMKTSSSGLHCFQSAVNGYGCYFGYDFARQQITEGHFSC